jgi:hypothetical protein
MQKYKVPLGWGIDDDQLLGEPFLLSISGAHPNVTGTPMLLPGVLGSASPTASADTFSDTALPQTSTLDRKLGFSEAATEIFNLTTVNGGADLGSTTAYRAYASAGHIRRLWTLYQPRVAPEPTFGPSPYWVSTIEAAVGASWVFAIHFDNDCKAAGLSALSPDEPWDPSMSASREAIQNYLIANKATFKLSVLQTGPEDPGLRAAVEGTTCAPSDLDACDVMFTKLKAARDALTSAPLEETDYTKLVTDGNVGPWIIGQVQAEPMDSIP